MDSRQSWAAWSDGFDRQSHRWISFQERWTYERLVSVESGLRRFSMKVNRRNELEADNGALNWEWSEKIDRAVNRRKRQRRISLRVHSHPGDCWSASACRRKPHSSSTPNRSEVNQDERENDLDNADPLFQRLPNSNYRSMNERMSLVTARKCALPVKCIAISFIIQWNKIHHQ